MGDTTSSSANRPTFEEYLASKHLLEEVSQDTNRRLMGQFILERLRTMGKSIEDVAKELPNNILPDTLEFLLQNPSWVSENKLLEVAHHLDLHFSYTVSAYP